MISPPVSVLPDKSETAYAAMEPFIARGRYVNYLDDDEAGDSVPAAYGQNYRRLQEIKTKYDPNNFFHMNQMNQNILPSR